jgi:LPS-assembly protein
LELQNAQQTISIRADSQQKEKDTYQLQGHVQVTYGDMTVTADKASYDAATGWILAEGHVTFTAPSAYLEADEAHYNVETGRGWFQNVRGQIHPKIVPRRRMLLTENPFYIRAEKVERLDEDTYLIYGARMTTCECEAKGWSIGARRARAKVDDRVVSQGSIIRFLRVPLFYTPIFVNSIARRPRQTGFLLPQIGNSSQKGVIIAAGFFWAINPSVDLLVGIQNYSIRGLGRSGQFRAKPSEDSEVTVNYFGVDDKGFGPQRQFRAPGHSLRAQGEARDLAYGFRGVLDVDYLTSLAFRLTFTDSFTQAVDSEVHQTGFLSKNFDAYSLNISASRYQSFLSATIGPANSVKIWQTPTFSFSGMDKQVGHSPFYFSFDASAGGVGRFDPTFQTPELSERLDFHPQILWRPKSFWGFHFTPSVGMRATRYGASLRPNGEGLTRLLGEFSVDLRPPSLARVLARPRWGYRFKHVIEPEIRYRLVRARNPEDILDVVRYDSLDILAETNEVEYSLTNALLFRKDGAGSGDEALPARQLVSWRLSQKFYFDPTFGGALVPGKKTVFDPTISLTGFAFAQGRRLSPVVSVLKFAPLANYDVELRADLSPSGGGVLNAGITANVHQGALGLSFTDFFINRTAVFSTPLAPSGSAALLPSFHLFRAVATYGDVNRKGFSGAFGLDYNFAQKIAHQVVAQTSYNFGCFSIDFEYRRFMLGTLRRDHQYRVAISLANVGSFGNLKPREKLY